MSRKTYQRGSVILKERASLPDLWVLRYNEGGIKRTIPLGTIQELPTKSEAELKADDHRIKITCLGGSKTIGAAIDRYLLEATHVRPHTVTTKNSNLWLFKQDWADKFPGSVNIMELETWLNNLQTRPKVNTPSRPYAKRTKLHIKAEIHCLFESIMRWGDMELGRNPISLVRVKGRPKKTRLPRIVTIEQYEQLRSVTQPHVSKMIMLGMCLGMRVSEILGLRWENVDFSVPEIKVEVSSVGKNQNDTKTESSNEALPLHPELVAELEAWKKEWPSRNGWVFESPTTGRPYHNGIMQRKHLHPAGKSINPPIDRLGWHDFRHTYRDLLDELETPLEVQKNLMRHSDIGMTTKYGGRKNKHLRKYNAAVVEMVTKEKRA